MKIFDVKNLFATSLLLIASTLTAAAYEHPRYAINAAIDTRSHQITGHEAVTFTNNGKEPTSDVYFHLYPNRAYTTEERAFLLRYAGYFKVDPFPKGFPKEGMSIKAANAGSQALTFAVEGKDRTILRVTLPQAVNPGESVKVDLDFALTIPNAYGRFGYNLGITALSRWYPILSVYNDNGWNNHPFYPFHRPFFVDAAYYQVNLTVPSDQVVIHTGELAEESQNTDRTKKLSISTAEPVRDFTMAMSARYKVVEDAVDGVTIRSYYLPGREARAREALKDARDLMSFYGKKFTPYPYKYFNIAPVYLGYGGEQMSNLVFIDTRVYEIPSFLPRYFDFLIAHETGHQWFYNILGVDSFNHIWMEEGFNSYFQLDYLEGKYGKNADVVDVSRLPDWMEVMVPHLSFRQTRDVRYKMMARAGLDGPIIGKLSSYAEPSSIFSLAYGKGSMVVAMLKDTMGYEAFDRAYVRLFKEYAHRNLDLSDFQRICSEESGKDLAAFFDQWLHSTKKLDVSVDNVQGKTVTVVNRGQARMPVDVDVTLNNGQKETLTWDGKDAKGEVTASADVKSAHVDVDEKLLDIDRTNNRWPRGVRVHPVPLYHPLYDVPVFWPEDAYNVVVGPEIHQGIGLKASVQKPYDWITYGGTDYDFSEQHHNSRIGYQLNYVGNSQTAVGVEMNNTTDLDDGEDDLVSGKLFLRRELWPAQYGLFDVNDHISLYLIRNQSLRSTLLAAGGEDIRNASYLKHDEAILGTALHLSRARPYPDPYEGYTVDTLIENSGHFLGASQQFTRAMIDYRVYQSLGSIGVVRAVPWPVGQDRHEPPLPGTLALRLKTGAGSVDDKNLFELGGIDGLRGFDRKTVRGANALLGSLEYRFPLVDHLEFHLCDNIVGLDKISAVAFFDAGQAWYGSFDDSKLRRDAGAGLRFHLNIGSFFEQTIIRLDAARAINDEEDDTHYWFGVNQAF